MRSGCLKLHMHRPTMILALFAKSNVVGSSHVYLGLLMVILVLEVVFFADCLGSTQIK